MTGHKTDYITYYLGPDTDSGERLHSFREDDHDLYEATFEPAERHDEYVQPAVSNLPQLQFDLSHYESDEGDLNYETGGYTCSRARPRTPDKDEDEHASTEPPNTSQPIETTQSPIKGPDGTNFQIAF